MKNAGHVRKILLAQEWGQSESKEIDQHEAKDLSCLFNDFCEATGPEAVTAVLIFSRGRRDEVMVRSLDAFRVGFPSDFRSFVREAGDQIVSDKIDLKERFILLSFLFKLGIPLELRLFADPEEIKQYDSVFVPFLKSLFVEGALYGLGKPIKELDRYESDLLDWASRYMRAAGALRYRRRDAVRNLIVELKASSDKDRRGGPVFMLDRCYYLEQLLRTLVGGVVSSAHLSDALKAAASVHR